MNIGNNFNVQLYTHLNYIQGKIHAQVNRITSIILINCRFNSGFN